MSKQEEYEPLEKGENDPEDPANYIFTPPLPNLWSDYEVDERHLEVAVTGVEAKKIYDDALKDWQLDEKRPEKDKVAVHQYGKTAIMEMPVLSLGGFFSLAVTVMHNRKLRCLTGCGCKAKNYLILNAFVVPLVLLPLAMDTPFKVVFGDGGAPLGSLKVERWLGIALLSTLGPMLYIFLAMLPLGCCEHQRHCDRLLDYSYGIGVTHIETARHYMESEGQLRPLLRRRKAKGEEWIVQTKIRPYDVQADASSLQDGGLYGTAAKKGGSLETLGYSSVDMITIHGVNSPHHVNSCLAPNGSIEQCYQLKEDKKCKAVGFAAHCHCGDIVKVIEKSYELHKPLEYVNLHYGFFSSYTNIDNQPAVLLAAEKGMGIYAISPAKQGGDLFKPSQELIDACAPLHPLEFGTLYLLTHKGIGDKGSISCGPADPSQYDRQLRALKLLPYAKKLLPPIVDRLRKICRIKLDSHYGPGYCDGLSKSAGMYSQGEDRMPNARTDDWVEKAADAVEDIRMPGNMNLSLLIMCHGLYKAFGMKSYMKRMATNLSWPGDWCAGGGLEVLRGKADDSEEVKAFRAAIEKTLEQQGAAKDGPNSADNFLHALREMETMVSPPKKGFVPKIFGGVMKYIMWWIKTSAWLGGASEAKEYGTMPKTDN